MNIKSLMSKYFEKPAVRIILIITGIVIGLLTMPSYSSISLLVNGPSVQPLNLHVANVMSIAPEKRVVIHHNFLASYFIQESSVDRSKQSAGDESVVATTMLKVPVSVAFNVWKSVVE